MTLYIYDKNEIKLVRTLEGVLTDRDTIKTDGGETIVLGDGSHTHAERIGEGGDSGADGDRNAFRRCIWTDMIFFW